MIMLINAIYNICADKRRDLRRAFMLTSLPSTLLAEARELHILIAYKAGAARQLIAEPDQQEQRNADIGGGHAVPVNGVRRERLIILPVVIIRQRTKAKIGPSGKKPER